MFFSLSPYPTLVGSSCLLDSCFILPPSSYIACMYTTIYILCSWYTRTANQYGISKPYPPTTTTIIIICFCYISLHLLIPSSHTTYTSLSTYTTSGVHRARKVYQCLKLLLSPFEWLLQTYILTLCFFSQSKDQNSFYFRPSLLPVRH